MSRLRGLVALIIAVLTACAPSAATPAATASAQGPSPAAGAKSPTPAKVRVAFAGQVIDHGHAWWSSVPQYMSFFGDEGLTVEVITTPGGTEAAQLMSAGGADVTITGPSTVLSLQENGVDAIAVYNTVQVQQLYPAVLADSPINSVAQFKGKRIGVPSLGSTIVPMLRAQVQEARLNPDTDVQWIAVGSNPQILQAYLDKRIDVIGLFDIQYALFTAAGYQVREFKQSALFDSLAFGQGWLTTRKFATEQADVLERFLRAVIKGSIVAHENPEAAAKIHWKVYPTTKPSNVDAATALKQSLAMVSKRNESQWSVDGRWGTIKPSTLEALQKLMLDLGQLKRPLDISKTYTNEFVERANRFDAAAVVAKARATVVD